MFEEKQASPDTGDPGRAARRSLLRTGAGRARARDPHRCARARLPAQVRRRARPARHASAHRRHACRDAARPARRGGRPADAAGLPLTPHGHAAPEGKRIAVIDAGGTNFRVATVHYEFGQPILEDERTLPMPGSEQDADWMDFIRLAADALEPLLDRVTQIGVCFSYPAENTPELDAKVLGMTKEVQLTGWEDHLVGADLAEELERRGCTKLPITVINDTPATYLSGATTIANNYANGFAGLVNGTGTNTCCLLPVRAIEARPRR
ncbi:MAG: hypothetical protein ACLUNO_10685 [Oscillospiraceae bacterium]